jgi:hypothetical protein
MRSDDQIAAGPSRQVADDGGFHVMRGLRLGLSAEAEAGVAMIASFYARRRGAM